MRSYTSPDVAFKQLQRPCQGYGPTGSREQLLSGCEWSFKLFDSPSHAPKDFHEVEFDAKDFTTVRGRASAI